MFYFVLLFCLHSYFVFCIWFRIPVFRFLFAESFLDFCFWYPVCICFCIPVLGFCFGILFWIPVLDYHDMHSCFCISLFDIPFLIPTLYFVFGRWFSVFCVMFPDSCFLIHVVGIPVSDPCFRSALPRAARAARAAARCRALRAPCARAAARCARAARAAARTCNSAVNAQKS